MKPLTLDEICTAVQGDMNISDKQLMVTSIQTDTRKELAGSLFIPLVGENFDGHRFIPQAFDQGAVCVLSAHRCDEAGGKPVIYVKDTKQALMDLAEYYRGLFSIPVVGITGSTGKTSTKDCVAAVLAGKYKVLKTEGNLNNEIGVPLTIFQLDDTYTALVLEMGMNHFGEIHNLSKMARPDLCVITNIGVSHAEYLGGREGIFKAKCEIFDFMAPTGKALLWGEDDMLRTLENSLKNVYYYGTEKNNFFHCHDVQYKSEFSGMKFLFRYENEEWPLEIPYAGRHMVLNATVAAGAGVLLGVPQDAIQKALAGIRLSKMRLDIQKLSCGMTVINDAYNANPVSVIAALDVLAQATARKVAILGDMMELGGLTEQGHKQVGQCAAAGGIDLLVCVGKYARWIREGYLAHGGNECFYFERIEDCLQNILTYLQSTDTILVKASRVMGFERIVNKIKGEV